MSNKGAIKKTPTTRNVKTKPKNVLPNEDLEKGGKSESRRTRTSQNLEQKGDGDKYTRLASTSSKSSTKESIKSLPNKSVKESRVSLSKTNSSTSRTVTKDTPTSRTKKSTSSNVARTRSTGKDQAGYSEKRGISTVYIPPSLKSKLNAKTDKNGSSISNSKGKVKRSNMPEEIKTGTVPRERRLSRTLSPSEVKMLHSIANHSASLQKKEEPKRNSVETSQIDNEYNYEDDFEDYESDFQECTDSETSLISEASNSSQSNLQLEPIELHTEQRKTVSSAEHQRVEEEHMHDSGHYELAEARKRAARVESIIANQTKSSPLLELRQPVNKAFSEDRPSENKSLPLSTDEGFEDSRSGDFAKSPPLSQISFIDFRNTKETEVVKKPKKALSRGEELLEMIKLDVMEWSLLECTPIPYDEFIRSYGKLNAQQMSTQTGEDNIDIEIQTEKIPLKSKWTQFPVTCRTNLRTKEDIDLFRMDQLGVGSDDTEEANALSTPSFDILRLSEFLNRAGGVMLSLLEERKLGGGNVFKSENDKLPFSDGVLKLSVNSVTFLAGRPVTIIHYSEALSKILLTVHSPAEEEIETSSKQDYITDCCIGCVWNISEPSMPIKLFYSSCPITTCCFHLTNYNVVFAGLQDGSMSLWNLKEDEMWHQKVTDKANELDWIIRTPTYTTAGNNEKHKSSSQIVAIRILSKIEDKTNERHDNRFVPIQICSLNEEGRLIIWSVLRNIAVNIDDLGLSYWGDIKLIKSQEILLQSHIEKKKINAAAFIDMHVDCIDTNSLYVATNTTNVLHTTCIGNKTNPTSYKTYDTRPSGNVTCIEVCPFEQSFFLVGCDDGTIRLHSLNTEKPILQLKDENCKASVKAVQWSKSKPFTIYVLDNNSRIHIWDLNDSDIQASCTINMQEWGCVTSMQLSSCKIQRDMTHQYLALGTETGNVEIHKLRTNFHYTKKEEYLQELNMFMRYIAIL